MNEVYNGSMYESMRYMMALTCIAPSETLALDTQVLNRKPSMWSLVQAQSGETMGARKRLKQQNGCNARATGEPHAT